jgi:hypothetical protein
MPCDDFIKQDRAGPPTKYFLTNAKSFVILQPMKLAITGSRPGRHYAPGGLETGHIKNI